MALTFRITTPQLTRLHINLLFTLLLLTSILVPTTYLIVPPLLALHNAALHSPTVFPPQLHPPPPHGPGGMHSGLPRALPITPGDLATFLPAPKEKDFRSIDKRTQDIDHGRYVYVRDLPGGGPEGDGVTSKLYIDTFHPARRQVVIKTYGAGARTNPLPAQLMGSFNPGMEFWWWLGGWGAWVVAPWRAMFTVDAAWFLGTWGVVGGWPVEIPATLWYSSGERDGGVVGVLDYFYLFNRLPLRGGGWQLVLPWFEQGGWRELAGRLAGLGEGGLRPYEVDRVFRGEFLGVLEALGRMHEGGYCHDDITPEAIFIQPPTNNSNSNSTTPPTWLLGNLASLRELAHPHHHLRPPPSHPPLLLNPVLDCRVVDTARLLKSYLLFLRLSTPPALRGKEFDDKFYAGYEGWSWVYWRFMRTAGKGGEGARRGAVEILREMWAAEEVRWGRGVRGEGRDVGEERRRWVEFGGRVRGALAGGKGWEGGERMGEPGYEVGNSTGREVGLEQERDGGGVRLEVEVYWELNPAANIRDKGLPAAERRLGRIID